LVIDKTPSRSVSRKEAVGAGMNVPLLDLKGQYLPLRAEIRKAIDEVCDAQTFTLGPKVEQFERNLAAYCGTKYAVGVSSGADAPQAIGAKRHGHRACSMGFGGCLSFYPTKNLGAFGDAGAMCTNDDAFYEKCQLLRVHGSGHRNTYYHQFVGGMFRLDAIQA